jgi:hypothetical protein
MNANPLDEPTVDELREAAYLRYISSGCVPGCDLENWLAAREQIVRQRLQGGKNESFASSCRLHFPPNASISRDPFVLKSPLGNRN